MAGEGEKPQSGDVVEKANGRLSRSKIDQARRTVQPLIMRRIRSTWLRGSGSDPVMGASSFDGVTGLCKPLCLPCAISYTSL